MDATLFAVATIAGVLGGFVGCVVALASRRRLNPRSADVDELADAVEKLGRVVRRRQMSDLRRGALDVGPLPAAPAEPAVSGPMTPKEQLRRRVMGVRSIHEPVQVDRSSDR